MNRDLFTVIAWDPRWYGKSIPPERTWENFFERDANDATTLMKVISVDIYLFHHIKQVTVLIATTNLSSLGHVDLEVYSQTILWKGQWKRFEMLYRALYIFQNIGIEKYSLVGWSDGGITALIMAGRNPQNVTKLVVWGANSFVTNEDIKLYESKFLLRFIM